MSMLLLSLLLMLLLCAITTALWNDSISGAIPLHGTFAGQVSELAGAPRCRVLIFIPTVLIEVSLALSFELGHSHLQQDSQGDKKK